MIYYSDPDSAGSYEDVGDQDPFKHVVNIK
jgi:hypothetical protein